MFHKNVSDLFEVTDGELRLLIATDLRPLISDLIYETGLSFAQAGPVGHKMQIITYNKKEMSL